MAASATNDGRLTRRALRSMFSRKNRSIRTRLIACFVLVALLMIVADAVGVWQFRLINAATQRLGNADETSLAVLRVHFDIDTFRDSVDLFAGSHDARQFTSEVASIRQKFLHDVNHAQQLAGNGFDAPDATIPTSLESLRVTFLSQLDTAVEVANAGEWSLLRRRLTTQLPALMEYSSSLVEKVNQQVLELRTKTLEEKQQTQQHLIVIVPLVGLLTLLSAGALGWYVTNAIAAPLSELTACAESLAQGDFQNQVNVGGNDELSVLGKAFNYAALQLQGLYDNLRRSEQELREVINAVPVHAWSALPNGEADFVNQRWQQFTGLPAERAFGWNWEAVLHPDDRAKFVANWRAALNSGQAMETEVRVRRVDGQYRCLLVRNVPLRDEHGNIVKWYGTGLDIEDRKRAESLLAGEKWILEMVAKGDPLAEILDSLCRFAEEQAGGALASILLVEHNRLRRGGAPSLHNAYIDAVDGTLIGPLAGSCGTAAYRGEQVIAEDVATDPLWADYRDLVLPHGLRACWSTPVFSSERKVIATFALYYREPRRSGSSHPEVIEQITHLAGIAIERKLAQDALRRSETYLSEAQRLSHTGSWTYNPTKHKTVYWSAEMFRMCGFDPQQGPPTGDAFLERVPPEDRKRVHETFYNAMQQKMEYKDEHRIILPDGTIKHIHSIGHPVLNRSGDVVEFVGSAVDVTERKRAEEERERLHQLEADLARINRISTMGELAASLAHEITQPISAASLDAGTCSEWLAHDEPNVEEARQAASRIIQDVTRASEIIGRVRSLYKKGELRRESLDVNEIIREMTGLLHTEAGRKSISIRTELADSLPMICADRVQLQQVFVNLALNAIDAIKDSNTPGTLTIKSQLDSGGAVLISVSDTGVGLPRDQTDKIFDAFFTTKSQGTGMGLSISRSIVESHGGHLWATTNSERGASFHFSIPADFKAA